jgi:hypothetical protein
MVSAVPWVDHGPDLAERSEYAPQPPMREPADALDALARAMRRSDSEHLAAERIAPDDFIRLPTTRGGPEPPQQTPPRTPGWAARESQRPWRQPNTEARLGIGR